MTFWYDLHRRMFWTLKVGATLAHQPSHALLPFGRSAQDKLFWRALVRLLRNGPGSKIRAFDLIKVFDVLGPGAWGMSSAGQQGTANHHPRCSSVVVNGRHPCCLPGRLLRAAAFGLLAWSWHCLGMVLASYCSTLTEGAVQSESVLRSLVFRTRHSHISFQAPFQLLFEGLGALTISI